MKHKLVLFLDLLLSLENDSHVQAKDESYYLAIDLAKEQLSYLTKDTMMTVKTPEKLPLFRSALIEAE